MAAEGVTAAAVTSYTQHKYPILSRYHVGQHPLAKEASLGRLEPLPETRAAFIKALTREMTSNGLGTLDPHTVKKYQDKMVLEGMGENVDIMYAREFQRWIRGVSVFNEPSLTPWGHRSMLHVPGAVEYIRELIQMRFDYQQSLVHLYMQSPRTLLDLELYYKYIVLQFGLVIPRNDGLTPEEGMPLAGDPRSFMSVSGMLSFLDDYQLTSFRDRDLPLTDQNKINLQDRNPNASLVGDLGPDIGTLKTVHQGLGPPRLMSNGQPSTNGSTAPSASPPNDISAILLGYQQEIAKLRDAQHKLKIDQFKADQAHHQRLRDLETAHKTTMSQYQAQFDAQKGGVAQPDLATFAQEQEALRKRAQDTHDEALRRLQEDYKRDRDDTEGKLKAMEKDNARLAAASKKSEEDIKQLTENSTALKAKMRAAKAALANAQAATQARTDEMVAEHKRQLQEKDTQIKASSGISDADWAVITSKHAAEREELEKNLVYWQGQSNAYKQGHATQVKAAEELQKTATALSVQLATMQTEATRHAEAAELARQTADQARQHAKTRKAELKKAQKEMKQLGEQFAGTQEEWVAYKTEVEKQLAGSELRLQHYMEQSQLHANDAGQRADTVAALERALAERDALHASIHAELQAAKAQAAANEALATSTQGGAEKYVQDLLAAHAQQIANLQAAHQAELEEKGMQLAYHMQASEQAGEDAAQQRDRLARATQTIAEMQAVVEQANAVVAQNAVTPLALVAYEPSELEQHAQDRASAASDEMQAMLSSDLVAYDMHQQAVAVHGGEPTASTMLEKLEAMNQYVQKKGTTTMDEYLEIRSTAMQLAYELENIALVERERAGDVLTPVTASDRNFVIDSYLNILTVAPPGSVSDGEADKYIDSAARSFNRTMHTLFSLPPEIDLGPRVASSMKAGDSNAIEDAFNAAVAAASMSNVGAALLSAETMESLREGLGSITGHFVQTAAKHGAERNTATRALEGLPVKDEALDQLNAVAAGEITGFDNGKAGLDLAHHFSTTSPIFRITNANIADTAGLDDATNAVQKTIQLVGTLSRTQGVSAMSAIVNTSTMVATHLADINAQLAGTVRDIEASGRQWEPSELGLLRSYISTAASKQALNQMRINIVETFAQMVTAHNRTSAFFQYHESELAQMDNVHASIKAEMADLDNQLNHAGYHLVRSSVERGGLALGASAEQYKAAVQIASTPEYNAKSLELVKYISAPTTAAAERPSVLNGVNTYTQALQLAVVKQERILEKATGAYTQAAYLAVRDAVTEQAQLTLANVNSYANTPGQLVVYVANNAARRMGSITPAESETLDMALLTEGEDEDEENISQDKMVALVEARSFRVLAQPKVQNAARDLNQMMRTEQPTYETVQKVTIQLATLQEVLRDMTAESAITQVLHRYIQHVNNYLHSVQPGHAVGADRRSMAMVR